MKGKKFVPVKPGSLTDLELLPKRFDRFAADVHESFKLLTEKILPVLENLKQEDTEHRLRIAHLEKANGINEARISALELATRKDEPS